MSTLSPAITYVGSAGVYIYSIHVHTHMRGHDLCSSVIFTQMADHIALQLFVWNSPSWPSSQGESIFACFPSFLDNSPCVGIASTAGSVASFPLRLPLKGARASFYSKWHVCPIPGATTHSQNVLALPDGQSRCLQLLSHRQSRRDYAAQAFLHARE